MAQTLRQVADTLHITIEQGATWDVVLNITQDSVAVDLTNATSVDMQIRERVGANSTLIEATTSNGRAAITAPATLGQITISIPATVTGGLNRTGVYDLTVTFSDGTVRRYLQGDVALSRRITI